MLMDDHLVPALAALRSRVNPRWLADESAKLYRIDPGSGIELAHGWVVDRRPEQPHRFAQMLLLTEEFIQQRPDLDIFTMSILVPEMIALGTRLARIPELGAAAVAKFGSLPD